MFGSWILAIKQNQLKYIIKDKNTSLNEDYFQWDKNKRPNIVTSQYLTL